MQYRAAFIKTFYDNMVTPYIVPEGKTVEKNKWYLLRTRFGEDIGQAFTDVAMHSRDSFFLKKWNTGSLSEHEIDDAEAQSADAAPETVAPAVPVSGGNHDDAPFETFDVMREVTDQELAEWKTYRQEEHEAYLSARREVKELGLDMKLVNVHILFQRRKVIFNFTADNRVDFRLLVKRLAGIFKTRIEMRQIGVRDAAKVQGGYGVCGVITCCSRSNCHINSIYLKMAKDQGFVVNSSKLTGLCGRLMCCLAYEMNFYTEELRHYPEQGAVVIDAQKTFTVAGVNVIKKEVYIMDEFHHQKKVQRSSLHFLKKEPGGKAVYRLQAEEPRKENQDGQQDRADSRN